ncbi:MAG TPA: WXG100 family type VII secretion target [Actinomycetospora sp.]|nr:WXG100 family type VII secretion target [Actinomycetospora sp.]
MLGPTDRDIDIDTDGKGTDVAANSGFSTDTATMQAVAKKINTTHAAMEGDLSRLRAQLADVAGTQWQGRAADAFGVSMTQWDVDAQRMNKALDDISALVNQAAGLMQTNQDGGVQAFRSAEGGGGAQFGHLL